jgi:hypothetical protein
MGGFVSGRARRRVHDTPLAVNAIGGTCPSRSARLLAACYLAIEATFYDVGDDTAE